jgi:2-(1,2-epoxy-1,2-dihydrophenyl)acetyl-CoA isomerase
MSFSNILYEEAVGVATITINRPHRLNALNIDTVHEMIAALGRASADAGVRVVVITGAGDAFCAGADLKDAPDPMTPAVAHEVVGLYLDYVVAIRNVEKPVVAKVNGLALGGGCCTALASDIRISSERARFGLAFVNIGISGADMGATYFLPRLVGYGRACEMLMTGEPMDAHEAERIGLVNRVVPHDDLDAATDAMVQRLASRPPLGLKFTKRALYSGLDRELKAALDYEHFAQVACLLTEDYQEGRRAFLEKRPPVFRGR